jgi:hypothetical protein
MLSNKNCKIMHLYQVSTLPPRAEPACGPKASQPESLCSPGNWQAQNSGDKYFSKETYAIIALKRGFGSKNRNFGVFSLGPEVPKTIFHCGCQGCRIISDQVTN